MVKVKLYKKWYNIIFRLITKVITLLKLIDILTSFNNVIVLVDYP